MNLRKRLPGTQMSLLSVLWRSPGLTRREIAEELGYSRPTVDKALVELRSLRLVESRGTKARPQGRPAKAFRVCESAWFALGLDLALPSADLILVNAWGEVLHETHFELGKELESPRGTLATVAELIRGWLDGLEIAEDQIVGLGVGIPGFLADGRVTFVGRHLPKWERVPVESSLESALSLPVLVNHDVHFMALGEVEARGWMNQVVLYLSIRPGVGGDIRIGASLCVRGRAYRGSHGTAGTLHRAIIEAEELAGLSDEDKVERVAERVESSLVHILPVVDPDWVVVYAESLGPLETPLVRRCIEDLEAALQGEYAGMSQVTSAAVCGASGAQQAAVAVIRELLRPDVVVGVEGGVRLDRGQWSRINPITQGGTK
jgi:DNA-binding transcriptional ArsR family regulator